MQKHCIIAAYDTANGNQIVAQVAPNLNCICNSDGELAFTSFDRALRVVTMNRVELLKEGTIHPTQKPVKLYRWLLENYAQSGQKIIAGIAGSYAGAAVGKRLPKQQLQRAFAVFLVIMAVIVIYQSVI